MAHDCGHCGHPGERNGADSGLLGLRRHLGSRGGRCGTAILFVGSDRDVWKSATSLWGDPGKLLIPRAQEEKLKVIPFLVAQQSLSGRVSKAGGQGERGWAPRCSGPGRLPRARGAFSASLGSRLPEAGMHRAPAGTVGDPGRLRSDSPGTHSRRPLRGALRSWKQCLDSPWLGRVPCPARRALASGPTLPARNGLEASLARSSGRRGGERASVAIAHRVAAGRGRCASGPGAWGRVLCGGGNGAQAETEVTGLCHLALGLRH